MPNLYDTLLVRSLAAKDLATQRLVEQEAATRQSAVDQYSQIAKTLAAMEGAKQRQERGLESAEERASASNEARMRMAEESARQRAELEVERARSREELEGFKAQTRRELEEQILEPGRMKRTRVLAGTRPPQPSLGQVAERQTILDTIGRLKLAKPKESILTSSETKKAWQDENAQLAQQIADYRRKYGAEAGEELERSGGSYLSVPLGILQGAQTPPAAADDEFEQAFPQ